jgi:predicted regulator of Ras-like GTPase activity (Roadblock/LC7/MglB family)
MKEFSSISKIPGVIAAVVGDSDGALVEWSGSVDGESSAAVHAFAVRGFAQAGEQVGLGELQRMSIVGPSSACVIAVTRDSLVGVYGDPSKPVAGLERRLQEILNL